MITNRQYTLRCIHTSLAFVFWSLILCTPFLLQTVQPDFPWNQPIIDALNNDSMDLTAICPVNLTRYASNTQWVVKKIDSRRFHISPRDPPLSSYLSHCLSDALFSARLLSPSAAEPTTIVALKSPVVSSKGSSLYVLELPSHLEIPTGNYTLSIRFEWAELAGAQNGMVCGQYNMTCDPLVMIESVGQNVKFIGSLLEIKFDDRIIQFKSSEQSTTTPPLCRNLTKLPGFWSNRQFFPTPMSKVCSLPSFTLPPPFSSSPKIIWIHLIGDSNLRNLYSHLSSSFGRGLSDHNFVDDSTTRNGNLQYISLRSFNGTYYQDSQELPDVIVSWNWFYQTATHFESNARELNLLVNETLADFLSRSRMDRVLDLIGKPDLLRDIAKVLRPTRLYISLGSHSEQLTTLGATASLNVLLSTSGIATTLSEATFVKFFTTTLVNSGNIPFNKFPDQDLVRNNFVIRAKNQVLMDRHELNGLVIDIGEMTEGITENYMKNEGKLDAVHFRNEVYEEIAKIVWLDLIDSL